MISTEQPLKNVTISIVSHGQQALIIPLLEQLHNFCAPIISKIIVTVNVPEDDLITEKNWSSSIELITNNFPRGFGANHNAAFTLCNTDWFLVLNPDVRLRGDAITPLLEIAQPTCGVLAPRVLEPGKTNPEAHRALLTPIEILQRHGLNLPSPTRPAWFPGLFMLFRSEALKQISGFDERYFMYGEDFDICARLSLKGWDLNAVEDITIFHEAQRASHRKWRHLRWHLSSLLKIWTSPVFWNYRNLIKRQEKTN